MSFSYQESIRNLESSHGEGAGLLSHMHIGYNSRTGHFNRAVSRISDFITPPTEHQLEYPHAVSSFFLTSFFFFLEGIRSHAIATYEV